MAGYPQMKWLTP